MWNIWQHIPEHINQVCFSLGPIQFSWYGIMYCTSFLVVYTLAQLRIKKHNNHPLLTPTQLSDLFFWGIIGVILGARIGYVLFYDSAYFMHHPLKIFSPWDWNEQGIQFTGITGMSYHGGFIGALIVIITFSKIHAINLLSLSDLLTQLIPVGYTFGRIGNFLNSELYGRATTVSWGMYFPTDPLHHLRHPSQLYEALGEGIILFCILHLLSRLTLKRGIISASYIIGYSMIRFIVEFFREPDSQLGFIVLQLTMGQALCIAMFLIGVVMLGFILLCTKNHTPAVPG